MSYKVDLKNFMARCEANYLRLLRLFPGMATDTERRLGLTTQPQTQIVMTVIERAKFTTLLSIEQNTQGLNGQATVESRRWNRPPVLKVRVYHDAKLAEVVSCDDAHRVSPNNAYPNKRMLQRDEKAQWNRFLEEWLTMCSKYGYVSAPFEELLGSATD